MLFRKSHMSHMIWPNCLPSRDRLADFLSRFFTPFCVSSILGGRNLSLISESSQFLKKSHHSSIIFTSYKLLGDPAFQTHKTRLLLYYWCTSRYQDSLRCNWPNDNQILFVMDNNLFQAEPVLFTKILQRFFMDSLL